MMLESKRTLNLGALLALAICACAPAMHQTNSPAATATPKTLQPRSILISIPDSSGTMEGWAVRAFRADGSIDSSVTLPAMFAAWSPDGRSIAYVDMSLATRTRLNVCTLSGRVDTIRLAPALAERETPYATWPIWSPAGDAVAVLLSALASSQRPTYEFAVLDVESLRVSRRYPIPAAFNEIFRSGGVPDQAAWSPDGKAVFLSWGGRLVIVDLETGELKAVRERVAAATWAPDGRALYFLSNPPGDDSAISGFFIYELAGRNPLRLADSAAIGAMGMRNFRKLTSATMALSPSGKMIAIGAGAGDSSAIYIYNTTPSSPVDVTKPDMVINVGRQLPVRLEWSPDDQNIAALMIGVPRYSVQNIDLRNRTVRMVAEIAFTGAGDEYVAMMKLLSWTR